MEVPSPVTLLYTYVKSSPSPQLSDNPTASILVTLFLIHYLNRAVISPLRTPNRARTHLVVPILGIIFNLVNGYLIGAWLASPGVIRPTAWKTHAPSFWSAVAIWAISLYGNVWHDEVLLRIRRKKMEKEGETDGKPYYAVPYGGLYKYIS